MSAAEFLDQPGRDGAFGAILDETAAAADDFCRVVERFSLETWHTERESDDPSCVSPRTVAAHVCGAARRYADYIRKALDMPHVDVYETPLEEVREPFDVRPLLQQALRYTEEAVERFHGQPEEAWAEVTFAVRWGPTYDPEMILEHGLVHLLRHRRQLERWGV